MKIRDLKAREILDSRGVPTVEAVITLDDGSVAKGAVPSGASTGATEVLEMRDGDPERYFGKGVLSAVEKVNNEIAPALIGADFDSQEKLDRFMIELDGTEQKSNLGGNSILAVSMAFCRATAQSFNIPLYEHISRIYWGTAYSPEKLYLPNPMILLIEGGAHGNWATDIQEYMVIPQGSRFSTFKDKLRAGAEIFKATHDILVKKGYAATVGFEGAFAPTTIKSNGEAFEIMLEGIEVAGYRPGEDMVMALDVASSEFYDAQTKRYNVRREEKSLNSGDWMALQTEWYRKYPVKSIEDPMDQEDWDGWRDFMKFFGSDHQVVGDDLLTTNVKRIRKCIELNAANAVLIKLNQIGSVSETLDAIRLSVDTGYEAIISHRGGETNDDFIADLVVATPANQSKFGGPDRGERLAKYNRLTEIEDQLYRV